VNFHTTDSTLLLIKTFTGAAAKAAAEARRDEEDRRWRMAMAMRASSTEVEDVLTVQSVLFQLGIQNIGHAVLPMAHSESNILPAPEALGHLDS
jgi:hypothetical protein